MGGERLWWTWGMGGRSATPNTSFLVYSVSGEWNESMEYDAANRSRAWPGEGNYSAANFQYDVFIMIVTASVLGLVILATVIGECVVASSTFN